MPLGFVHSLFDVADDVLKRAGVPGDSQSVVEAIAAANVETLVDRIAWNGDKLPGYAARNVAKTPLVGGQWRRQPDGNFDLVIVDNTTAPEIPLGGKMEPT